MASYISVDARSSSALQTVIRGMAAAPTELAKQIRKANSATIKPAIGAVMRDYSQTHYEFGLVVASHVVSVSDRNIKITAGTKRGQRYVNGLNAKENVKVAEFGGGQEQKRTYSRRSRKGVMHQVTRRMYRAFRPPKRNGYTFFPTVAVMAPRILAMWTQTSIRLLHEVFEGKVR